MFGISCAAGLLRLWVNGAKAELLLVSVHALHDVTSYHYTLRYLDAGIAIVIVITSLRRPSSLGSQRDAALCALGRQRQILIDSR